MNWLAKTITRKKFMTVILISLIFISISSYSHAAKKSKTGYLGISIERLTHDDKQELDVSFGILVTRVHKGTAAEESGLKPDDVIQYYNGERVRKTDLFIDLVRDSKPGARVEIKLVRNGKQKEVTVKVGEYKSEVWGHFKGLPGKKLFISSRGGYLGIQLLDLNKDLGEYFGVKNGQGVLILKIEKDSPAFKSGLKSGDVLLKIDKAEITEASNAKEILDEKEEGDEINIIFLRHKKKNNLKVELGARSWNYGMQILRDLGNKIRISAPRMHIHIPDFKFREFDWHHFKDSRKKIKNKLDKARKKIKEKAVLLKDSISI